MINTFIVEDEVANIKILKNLLAAYCPQVYIVGQASTVEDASKLIKKEKPELVLMDIEIPGGNAFSLLDKLKPIQFEIIFITAYDNYTLKAIKYSALDYILKPVNIEELIAAINKVSEKINSQQLQQRVESLFSNLNLSRKNQQSLAVPASFGYEFISINTIIRCEAFGKYTHFHLNTGRKVISVRNLREYEDLLPNDIFFRIHHSHLININFIKRYHKGTGIIEMEDEIKIP